MQKLIHRSCFLLGLTLFVAAMGCQSWHSGSVLPGLTATKGERKIVKQAQNDPFPSPSDVGMESGNDEARMTKLE